MSIFAHISLILIEFSYIMRILLVNRIMQPTVDSCEILCCSRKFRTSDSAAGSQLTERLIHQPARQLYPSNKLFTFAAIHMEIMRMFYINKDNDSGCSEAWTCMSTLGSSCKCLDEYEHHRIVL